MLNTMVGAWHALEKGTGQGPEVINTPAESIQQPRWMCVSVCVCVCVCVSTDRLVGDVHSLVETCLHEYE